MLMKLNRAATARFTLACCGSSGSPPNSSWSPRSFAPGLVTPLLLVTPIMLAAIFGVSLVWFDLPAIWGPAHDSIQYASFMLDWNLVRSSRACTRYPF